MLYQLFVMAGAWIIGALVAFVFFIGTVAKSKVPLQNPAAVLGAYLGLGAVLGGQLWLSYVLLNILSTIAP